MSYVCLPAIVIESDLRHHPGDFTSIEAAAAEIAAAARALLDGTPYPPRNRPPTSTQNKVLCYAQATVNSAMQMVRDLNRARLHAGKLALTPLSHWFDLKCDEHPAECAVFFGNSESYYLFGSQGFCYGDPAHPTRLGGWCIGRTGFAGYHPGYIYLSALQLVQDDVSAQDVTKTFEPVRSPEGILPYPPARLAQVQLTDTYNLLRQTEENALEVLAQSAPPAIVAEISTSETVTDPIGRLVAGQIVQNVLGDGAVGPAFPGTLPAVGQASRLTSGDVTQAPGQGADGIVQAAAEANGERQPVLPGGMETGGTPVLPHTDIAASITTGASLLRVALILGTVLFSGKK